MLDMKFIRANLDRVRDGARAKRFEVDFDRLISLDDQRKEILGEEESLRNRQKTAGKEIAQLDGDEKQAAIAALGQIPDRIKELQESRRAVEEELDALAARVPQPPDPEVPEGLDDTENVELRTWGEKPTFDFEPKDHVALGTDLGIIDFPRAAKLAGSQTYMLVGDGALLELAVLRYALDTIVQRGFVPMITPTLVRYEPLYGTAYFPGGEEQAYACEKDRLWLTGTSEVPVTAFHMGETLEASQLPLRYAGYSSCYRREAGAAGRDTKGLYRIHQFNKVEQVVICAGDEALSREHHLEILENSEAVLQGMGLPYRVVNVCSGDLGQGQAMKYDIECWMPSRGWGETHSASRFYEFQSRRLDLRYRDDEGRLRYCHTLNNTVIATPRVLIPLLENNQREDGTVAIPEVLVPYMGGRTEIVPRG
jgi:seryl-tRNA synthetase